MASAIIWDSFEIDGINIGDLGYMIGEINGSGGVEKNNVSSEIKVDIDKTYNSNLWQPITTDYNAPIIIPQFDIIKISSSGLASELTETEIRNMDRLLKSKHYGFRKFRFLNSSNYDIYYYVICTKCEAIYIGGKCYGFSLEFQTNRPYGITNDIVTIITVNETNYNYTFVDDDDEVGYENIPSLKITMAEAGTFSIYNAMTNSTFEIENCVAGEVINVNGDTLEITSSVRNSNDILDDFNDVFFIITNTYSNKNNVLTINGRSTLQITTKFIRKVGVGVGVN